MLCHRSLKEAVDGDNNSDKAKSGNNKLMNDPNFQAIMRELDLQAHIGFAIHPKMEKLKMLVLNHFGTKLPDEAADTNNGDVIGAGVNGVDAGGIKGGEGDDTRVMVFVTFREAVEQLVEFLNQESPIIRATKFIGQGADKAGKKGFAQKDQLDVCTHFTCFSCFGVLLRMALTRPHRSSSDSNRESLMFSFRPLLARKV